MGLSDAQLELRRSGLTATDMVVLAGFDPYGSPLEVYEAKLGAPPRPSTRAMRMGNAAEAVIADDVAEKYSLRCIAGDTIRCNDILPWVLATPDRFVIDDRARWIGVVECKLVGWRMVHHWISDDGEVVFPDSLAVQCTWQMGTTKTKRAYVGALLGGWGEDDFHHTTIELNEKLWGGLLEIGDRFWKDHVLARVPPTPDGSERAREVLERIYPTIKRPMLLPADAEAADLMRRYIEARDRESAAKEEKGTIGNLLRSKVGDAQGLRDGAHKVTWTPQKGKVSIEKIAAHLGWSETDLDQFRGDESRVLRVNPLTKKELAYASTTRELVSE